MLGSALNYQLLSDSDKEVYRSMFESIKEGKMNISIPSRTLQVDLIKMVQYILDDFPQFVYFDRTKISISRNTFSTSIALFSHSSTPNHHEKIDQDLELILKSIVTKILKETQDDFEMLLAISEYLQDHVTYDDDELISLNGGEAVHTFSHNAYGALVKQLAVCSGFASAFCLIAKRLGFECMVVRGRSNLPGIRFQSHAWNIVKYKDKFYHIDVTWEVKNRKALGIYFYNYFGLDDSEMLVSHEWDYQMTPICNSTELSYFHHQRLIVNSISNIKDITLSLLKSHGKILRLKMNYNLSLPPDPMNDIKNQVCDILPRNSRFSEMRYSWNADTRNFICIFS